MFKDWVWWFFADPTEFMKEDCDPWVHYDNYTDPCYARFQSVV
jgi:hypothetical protein